MRFVAILATVAAFALPGAAAPAAQDNNAVNYITHPAPVCTAATFRGFAKRVWNPSRWKRGAPKKAAIHAQRERVRCAGPENRKAMQHAWAKAKGRYNSHRRYCYSGPVFAGRISTFSGGLTAGGYQATEPGIALRSSSTLGEIFYVKHSGGAGYLRQTDWGPASWTGRAIDITTASQGIVGTVVTDTWGSARMIPGSCL